MKNQDPAFLMYSADFLVGTMAFTDVQVGRYTRLMCLQHQKGHLDAETMQNVCGGTEDVMVWNKFEVDSEGKYFNQRLEDEIVKRAKHRERQAKNAAMRWPSQPPARSMPDLSQPPARSMPLEDENENVNSLDQGSSLKTKIKKHDGKGLKRNSVDNEKDAAAAYSFLVETLQMDLIQAQTIFKNHPLEDIQEKINLTRKRVEGGQVNNPAAFFLAALARNFTMAPDVQKKIEDQKDLAKTKAHEVWVGQIEFKLKAGFPINQREYEALPQTRKNELDHNPNHFKSHREWVYFDPKITGVKNEKDN